MTNRLTQKAKVLLMGKPRQNMSLSPCKKNLMALLCAATVSGFLLCPTDRDQEISQSFRTVSLLGHPEWNTEILEAERLLDVEMGTISGATVIAAPQGYVSRGNKVFAGIEIAPACTHLHILNFRADGKVGIRSS